MIRLFQTNKVRKVIELEGDWDFQPLKDNQELPFKYTYRLPVPGCWEMHPQFATYRGKGVYRRRLEITEKTSLRLSFKGVSHTADVYFDGEKVAHHYNAYTPFTATITDVAPGEHELTVKVDNSFSAESTLHTPNDYYTYGGIIRPVAVEYISDVFIERIQFRPRLTGVPSRVKDQWQAEIAVYVSNIGRESKEIELVGHLQGKSFSIAKQKVPAGETVLLQTSEACSNVEAWSSANPALYLLEVQLFEGEKEEAVDDLIERVGFREISTYDGKLELNGEELVLKGFNRHEDHPLVGASFSYSLMVQDLELMLDMGANSVRTSHYPYDERFLDLCDERGIYIWEENHARGFSLEHMRKPNFQQQCLAVNKEMVENHYNHPSIIIWAILNECASHTLEGREMYKEQIEQIRELDSSRLLSFASHHREQELCFDLVDVVSFNLYPLWYTDEDPAQLLEQAQKWADNLGGGGKPIIMSEFGADGYYGLRDPSRVKGTEERHADIIESNLAAYTNSAALSGMYIWQFADCRVVEGTGWLLTRAGTQNSKGIVDKYRRPKLAYDVVKKYYQGE